MKSKNEHRCEEASWTGYRQRCRQMKGPVEETAGNFESLWKATLEFTSFTQVKISQQHCKIFNYR